ncbi:MAG: M56 family metallopeptidase [Syntrophomonas sp.]|uniref:M56 family metallopeptidase n=1 Tax=Syntrophomonas sp. TaxID=2053627 RepID=UPI0026169685|nr:M56 family metallopeptidase [Syntrophomonas sp.]MDD4627344.1 M56 family metallopeptidase [Syntrophomonas sp.]
MIEILFNILTLSLSMTPIIAILLLTAPLLNKIYISNWRYFIWLAVSLRLIIPFSGGAATPFSFNIASAPKESISAVSGLVPHATSTVSNLSATAFDFILGIGIVEIMVILYLAGALAFLLVNIKSYLSFRSIVRSRLSVSAESKIARLVAEISCQQGLKSKVKICICQEVSGPLVVGLFRPVLLLPHDHYDDTRLRMILSHELNHIKRHDIAYKVLLLLVRTVHWFNPLVHIMAARAERDIEITCDQIALQGTGTEEKRLYSLMIIEMAAHNGRNINPAVSTGFKSGRESLQDRVINIFDRKHKKKGTGALVFILIALLFGGSLIQINDLPVKAGEIISAPLYEQGIIRDKNTAPIDDRSGIDVDDPSINNHNADIDKQEKEATEAPAIPSAQTIEPETPSQPAEVVIIDLAQLTSDQTIDTAQDN